MPVTIELKSNKILLNSDIINLNPKQWSFVATNTDSGAYSPRVVTIIVSGGSGCATVQEGLDALYAGYPPTNYSTGNYARVSVFDDVTGCGTFHWFIIT